MLRQRRRRTLLNGHVDVVEVEPRADWTQPDPFAAVLRDGRLYGRGACDMKGGVACMVLAACNSPSSAWSWRAT